MATIFELYCNQLPPFPSLKKKKNKNKIEPFFITSIKINSSV